MTPPPLPSMLARQFLPKRYIPLGQHLHLTAPHSGNPCATPPPASLANTARLQDHKFVCVWAQYPASHSPSFDSRPSSLLHPSSSPDRKHHEPTTLVLLVCTPKAEVRKYQGQPCLPLPPPHRSPPGAVWVGDAARQGGSQRRVGVICPHRHLQSSEARMAGIDGPRRSSPRPFSIPSSLAWSSALQLLAIMYCLTTPHLQHCIATPAITSYLSYSPTPHLV